MSILFITKLKTWMFVSYACHSLIQDNVFHIITLTAPLNDVGVFVLFSMCIPTLNSLYYDKMLTHIRTVLLCHGDNV